MRPRLAPTAAAWRVLPLLRKGPQDGLVSVPGAEEARRTPKPDTLGSRLRELGFLPRGMDAVFAISEQVKEIGSGAPELELRSCWRRLAHRGDRRRSLVRDCFRAARGRKLRQHHHQKRIESEEHAGCDGPGIHMRLGLHQVVGSRPAAHHQG